MTKREDEMFPEDGAIEIIKVELIDTETGEIISRRYKHKRKREKEIDYLSEDEKQMFSNRIRYIEWMRSKGKISSEQALVELDSIRNRMKRLKNNRRLE